MTDAIIARPRGAGRGSETSLGLVPGLRAEQKDRQYRCNACSKMQPAGSIIVWVPDHIRRDDPAWAVEQACKDMRFNGSFSGWCINCAPKMPKSMAVTPESYAASATPVRVSWWQRLFGKQA